MGKLIGSILIVVIAVAMFGKTTSFDFAWDDRALLTENEQLNDRVRNSVATAWTQTAGGEYTPIPETVWAIYGRLADAGPNAGWQPGPYHALNLTIHAINSVLVLLVLGLLFKGSFPAFAGALLFALHPLQVEPVAWISGLRYLLGTFFGLIALWQYLHFGRRLQKQIRPSRAPFLNYYIATGSFIAAVLCMPAMVVLPLIAMVLENLLPRTDSLSQKRSPAWALVLWLIIALPFGIWTIGLQNSDSVYAQTPFWFRPFVAGDALAFYISKVFVPLGIGPDYGRSPAFVEGHWWGYLAWIAPVVLMGILLFWRDRARTWLAAGLTVTFFALLPFLGLIAFESQANSTVANRYAYFAMLGPALAFGFAFTIRRNVFLPAVCLVVLVGFSYLTHKELRHWQDDRTLWSHALDVNPESPLAHRLLADRFREQGEWAKAREHYGFVLKSNKSSPDAYFHLAEIERRLGAMDTAVELYKQSLALAGNYAPALNSLGLTLASLGKDAEALQNFEAALEAKPDWAEPAFRIGQVRVRLGKFKEAIKPLDAALATGLAEKAQQSEAHALLGLAWSQEGDLEKTKSHLETALKLDPEHVPSHRILGDVLYEQGDDARALTHYNKALTAIDDDYKLFRNVGLINLQEKKYSAAEANFKKAHELQPENADILANLAAANFHLRRFEVATEQLDQVLKMDPRNADAYYYLGDMKRWSGKTQQALGYYYKALKRDKHHALAHYRLGNYFMGEERPRQAVYHYRSALKQDPEDSRIAGRLRRAEKALQEDRTF